MFEKLYSDIRSFQIYGRFSSITTISNAMLMAAGLGTRLMPFTEKTPKCLMPVLGIPLAQYSADLLKNADIKNTVINIHHLPLLSKQGLVDLDWGNSKVVISDESKLLLGSAGGLRKALPHLGEGAFFILNSDIITDLNLQDLETTHLELKKRHGVKLTLAVRMNRSSAKYREIVFDSSTLLVKGVGELVQNAFYFMGNSVMETELLRDLQSEVPLDFVESILKPAIAKNQVGVHLSPAAWIDVGSPKLWHSAHFELMKSVEEESIDASWVKTILNNNIQINPLQWISRFSKTDVSQLQWNGSGYWHGDLKKKKSVEFGPNAVAYGKVQVEKIMDEMHYEEVIVSAEE